MTMEEWAENEVKLACKKENPGWDGTSFDYGCSCYASALKAYKSICKDGHSGFSYKITKNILIKLLNGEPLSPIKDEDFFANTDNLRIKEDPLLLKQQNLKSDIQCPRLFRLFRKETLDGKVYYTDVERAYGIDIDTHSTYGSGFINKLINEMFPITMPYCPSGKYKVYTQDFLLNKNNGDYDHKAILYIETPTGEKIMVDKYYKEENGKMIQISKEEYDKDFLNRINKK